MHRCPNRACPSRGPRDADQLGAGPADIEGVGEQLDPAALGARARPLAARPLPADEGAAARARRLRGDRAPTNAIEAIEQSKRTPFSARAARAQHPGRRLGDGAEPRARTSARSTSSRPRRRRRSRRSRGSGPSAPRRSSSGSRTRRTGRSSTSCASSACASRPATEERPVEGPLTRQTYVITGTLESFTRDEARKALEAKGAKVADSVSKKTTGVIVGEEPGLEAEEGAGARRAGPRRGRAEEATCAASDGREAVLRAPRPVGRDGAAVLEHREGVAALDVAGERRGDVQSCRSSRARCPRAGGRAHPVGERPAPAGDRQRGEQERGAGPGRPSAARSMPDERPRGQPVERREPGAVDDPHARRAGRLPRRAPRARSPRRRRVVPASPPAAPSCLRSSSAVKLSLSRSMKRDDLRERRPDSTDASGTRVRVGVAGRRAPVDRDAGARERVAEQRAPPRAPGRARCGRGSGRGRPSAPRAAATRSRRTTTSSRAPCGARRRTTRRRRRRRVTGGSRPRAPARASAARSSARERRVAVPVEHEVAAPDRRRPARHRRGRPSRCGSSGRARPARA